jgi:endonuclease YncB( thermonuclease family)
MSDQPAYTYDAWLIAHVDGDTIHAGIDLGCDVATTQTLRFYGINAPEMSTPEGKVAAAWVQGWFTAHAPDGKFILKTTKDKREKFGRYLATVVSSDGLHNLNEEIVAAGMAVPYFPK